MRSIRLFALCLALVTPFALPARAGQSGGAAVLNAPTFSPTGTETGSLTVVVADFDGDGRDDVATGNFGASTVSILLNDGDGGFGEPRLVDLGGMNPRLGVADFDRDGHVDLVATTSDSPTVELLLGVGDGTFRPGASVDACLSSDVAVADFDGNGTADVAIAASGCLSVGILFGDGDGRLDAPVTFRTAGVADLLRTGDLDGDGRPDLITHGSGNGFDVWLNDGSGGFGTATNVATERHPRDVRLADLDADGILDAIVGYDEAFSVGTFLGDGAGGFRSVATVQVPLAPLAVAAADFDGDGTLDVAALASAANGRFQILLGDGAGGLEPATAALDTVTCPYGLAVGDLDGDAVADFVFADGCRPAAGVLLGRSLTAKLDVCARSDETGERFEATTLVAPGDPAYGYWEYHTLQNGVASGHAPVVKRTARRIRMKDTRTSDFTLDATFDLARATANVLLKVKRPTYRLKFRLTSSTFTDGGCL